MIPSLLTGWFRPRPRPDLPVVMFSRAGCHLCDAAWQTLVELQKTFGFRLDKIDIAGDPDLTELHGPWVPVVTVNGKVRFRGGLDPILFRRLLRTHAPGSGAE